MVVFSVRVFKFVFDSLIGGTRFVVVGLVGGVGLAMFCVFSRGGFF